MSMSLSLRPLMSTRVFEVAKAPKPRRSTLVLAPLTPPNRLVSCTPGVCAMISCSVCAGECAISSAVITRRRRADDAGELPVAAAARALRRRLGCGVRAGPDAAGSCRSTAQRPARRGARSMPRRRSVLARVRFGSVGEVDLDRRQLIGMRLLRLRAGDAQRDDAVPGNWRRARSGARRCGCDGWKTWFRPRYDVSGTSQRTKSHHRACANSGEANACTPRPTSSRVTTADGRSPGSRVVTLRRLPRTEIPSGL